MNYMVYMRGSRHDYDDWAANGCDGWRYCDIEKYFMKAETDTNPDHTIEGGSHIDNIILQQYPKYYRQCALSTCYL